MSFRLKLILVMAALVSGLLAAALIANQRVSEQQYRQLVDEQLGRQLLDLRQRRKARLEAVFARVRDAARNPRLAAGFLMDDTTERSTRLYTDVGAQLAPVLDQFTGKLQPFFILANPDGSIILPPSPQVVNNGIAVDERLREVLPNADATELRTTAGYLVLGEGDTAGIFETVVHPMVDDFDNTFLGTLVLALPVVNPADLLNRRAGTKLALSISGQLYGDSIPVDDGFFSLAKSADSRNQAVVDIGGERHEVFAQPVPQDPGFDPALQVTAFSLQRLEQSRAQFKKALLIVGLAAFAVGVAFSFFAANHIARPIAAMTRQTREIQAGNLGATISVSDNRRDEVAGLIRSLNEMSRGLELKEKYRSVLDRVSDPKVAEELTRGDLELGGQESLATVMFCDIRGFTSLTESMAPTDIVTMLNEHMTEMTDIIHRHHGVIDKFVGDEIMAVFGVPHARGEDALDAVYAAIEMTERRRLLNTGDDGSSAIEIGIGVATGNMLVGCMGSRDRLNYTVLGMRVNLAARLCSRAAAGEILIDNNTATCADDRVRVQTVGEVELKGFSKNPVAHRVISHSPADAAAS